MSTLWPPQGRFEIFITSILLLLMTWAVPWSILEEDCMPGSNIFGIIVVMDVCFLLGKLVSYIRIPKLPPFPPLLGMLIGGIGLINIPFINFAKDIDPAWSSALRSIALTAILVKAGLELDGSALKTLKAVCLRLTALPCIVETITCAVTCKLLLGFPWEWGLLLGFVLAAVTPAVIVPSMLKLQEEGYGTAEGIPTLVIAASSFDDVLAISGFSVVLGITFSSVDPDETVLTMYNETTSLPNNSSLQTSVETSSSAGEIAWIVLRGPVEMACGILFGSLLGVILWYIPNFQKKTVVEERTVLVFGFGIISLFASRIIQFPGAGALAVIVAPFVAGVRWGDEKELISNHITTIWIIFEPLLFGLIGAEIKFSTLTPGTVGTGIAILFIGLVTRSITSYGAVSCSGFSVKEKIFICLSWIPKATVQAAIGPVALDHARKVGASEEIEDMASQVLTIAVLSILITAPLGAAAIGLSGPKLLQISTVAPEVEVEISMSSLLNNTKRTQDPTLQKLTEEEAHDSVVEL